MSNALFDPPQSAMVFGAAKEVLNGLLSELPNLGLSNAKPMA
jgi:NAD(P) transhydrogenase subunit beta